MKTLLLQNLTKRYLIKKDKYFTALKATNISFDSTGLVAIVGKSGSGKSTLINLIARIDTPSEGDIFLNGKSYKSFKKKRIEEFYNKDIGIVFQSYHLFEDKSVLFNVELPSLIGGINKKKAKEKATNILEKVGINRNQLEQKASLLSGGEKQRVAIARAIINSPKILLCDEPTGALDSKNSKQVMDIIKKLSKERLVIMVSHNLQIVNEYADRIIEIADGQIVKDTTKNKCQEVGTTETKKHNSSNSWIDKFASSNYKKRALRNILSSVALTISLSMLYLVVGFMTNKDNSIRNACYRQFDFGAGTVSLEEKTMSSGAFSLTKSTRPSLESLTSNLKISGKYEICLNYSSILPQNIRILYDNEVIEDLAFTPIYSFDDTHIDKDLLAEGRFPNTDNLSEVVINETAARVISTSIKKDAINEYLYLDHSVETNYVSEYEEYISDTFYLYKEIQIVGVVKEINYLSTPKIYYSYSAFEEFTKEYVLENLSTYNNSKTTWYDRVAQAEDYSPLSSYSYSLFLKDYRDREYPFLEDVFTDGLVYSSSSILLTNSLFNFLSVAEYGVLLFLIIAFIGTVLILSIMSFTNFSEDHRSSAILTSIGASQEQIEEIYLEESFVNGFLSFLLSIPISIGVSKLINHIVHLFIDIESLISIPLQEFLGMKFLFPIIVFLITLIVMMFSTIIPIYFSKRKSIKGELQSL